MNRFLMLLLVPVVLVSACKPKSVVKGSDTTAQGSVQWKEGQTISAPNRLTYGFHWGGSFEIRQFAVRQSGTLTNGFRGDGYYVAADPYSTRGYGDIGSVVVFRPSATAVASLEQSRMDPIMGPASALIYPFSSYLFKDGKTFDFAIVVRNSEVLNLASYSNKDKYTLNMRDGAKSLFDVRSVTFSESSHWLELLKANEKNIDILLQVAETESRLGKLKLEQAASVIVTAAVYANEMQKSFPKANPSASVTQIGGCAKFELKTLSECFNLWKSVLSIEEDASSGASPFSLNDDVAMAVLLGAAEKGKSFSNVAALRAAVLKSFLSNQPGLEQKASSLARVAFKIRDGLETEGLNTWN